MSAINIKQLLEAGVHFGHQTRRWNPKMKEFIFGERNGIYIIDLQKTLKLFKDAVQFVEQLGVQGKTILFVGTKRQAQEAIEEEARRCGMYFVNNRWLGGLLTNFATVQNSVRRYKELESMRDNGFYDRLSKKEVARLERERKKLEKNLRGIRDMDRLPDAVFVVDSNKEGIAVREAAKLKIPVIAVVDTNCDPDLIEYVIPGNDDALRAVRLFASTISEAFLAGRALYEARQEAEKKEAEERAAQEAAQRKAREAARRARESAAEAAEAKVETSLQSEVEADEVPAVEEAKTKASPKVSKASAGGKSAAPKGEAASKTTQSAAKAPRTRKPARKKSPSEKTETSPEAAPAEKASAAVTETASSPSPEADEEKIEAES